MFGTLYTQIKYSIQLHLNSGLNGTIETGTWGLIYYKSVITTHPLNPIEVSIFQTENLNPEYWAKSIQRLNFHNFPPYGLKSSK